MGSSYTPPVNLHSPGQIGDITPSTIQGTAVTVTSTATDALTLASGGLLAAASGSRISSEDPPNSGIFASYIGGILYIRLAGPPYTTKQKFDANTGRVSFYGLPTSPAGLSTGDIWNNIGVLTIVN